MWFFRIVVLEIRFVSHFISFHFANDLKNSEQIEQNKLPSRGLEFEKHLGKYYLLFLVWQFIHFDMATKSQKLFS